MIRTAALAIALATVVNTAQAACTPIQFAPGTSSATVNGMARNDEPFACFTLATGRGQTATARLVQGPKDDAAFNIVGVVDNRDSHTFKTEAKTYTITVYHMFVRMPDHPFTLQVSVK